VRICRIFSAIDDGSTVALEAVMSRTATLHVRCDECGRARDLRFSDAKDFDHTLVPNGWSRDEKLSLVPATRGWLSVKAADICSSACRKARGSRT
jgi:hypothetical protein